MLGYSDEQVSAIVAYIDEHKSIVGAPGLDPEHLPVFACSMGDNTIHYLGHVRMMGAVQPFISGAISKTVNMPEDATVEDVEQLHLDAWRLGRQGRRDLPRQLQGRPAALDGEEGRPTVGSTSAADAQSAELYAKIAPARGGPGAGQDRGQPRRGRARCASACRASASRQTFAFRVADCEGYVTVGEYEDGRPGEVFIKVSKQGSTLAGIMDAFSISISLGLQHGVPLATYVRKYSNMKFEPSGMTDDADLRIATSLVDYIFRRLALDYLSVTSARSSACSRRASGSSRRCRRSRSRRR